jgi:hypothetical protein
MTEQVAPVAEETPAPENRQTDIIETPAVEANTAAEHLSPKYAALARREKAIRTQQMQLQKERDAFKAEMEQIKSSYVPKNQLKDLLVQDPSQIGLSQEDLLNLALNQPTQESQFARSLESKIQQLEEKLASYETKANDRTQQAYEQAVNQIRSEAKVLIDSDPRFETVKEEGAHEAVVELIRQMYDENNVLLSVDEAAQQIEDHLLEKAIKLAGLKKVKERLNPPQAPEQPGEQKPQIEATQGAKTLTHATSASTKKPLTEKERIERAILAFSGQLPQ